MITFKKLIKESAEINIYCDMDGVLCNFEKEFEELCGESFDSYKVTHDQEELWTEVRNKGIDFWSKMEWMPDGKRLWSFLKSIKNIKLTVLSAPAKTVPDSVPGKKIWIKRNLGSVPYILIEASQKSQYANPQSILVDDYIRNITQWTAAGGISIHHTSASDSIKKVKNILQNY